MTRKLKGSRISRSALLLACGIGGETLIDEARELSESDSVEGWSLVLAYIRRRERELHLRPVAYDVPPELDE